MEVIDSGRQDSNMDQDEVELEWNNLNSHYSNSDKQFASSRICP